MIENTRNRDPLIHLLGTMSDGASGYIEGMEKQGQRQILHSDRLPTRSHSDDKEFLDLGFEFGDPDPGDPMFRPAKLPDGWKRRGSDHAMWSYIDDEFGRERVSIFYKAAFYDRDAFMSLSSVSAYADKVLHGTVAEPVFDDEWCTRAAFAEALMKMRERAAERVALYEGSDAPWAAEELSTCRDELAKIDALIAKYPAVSVGG